MVERLLRPPPCVKGEAEEAWSCCFEREREVARGANSRAAAACRSCGTAEVRVLLP